MKLNKKTKVVCFSFLFLSLILFVTVTEALPVTDVFDTEFDTAIEDKMGEARIFSSTLSIIKKTEVVFEKGYGEQTDLDLVYPLYSINKVLIGVAILQLIEQGFIDLNADINTYLPYIIENPNFPATAITCKHLLSHRAGINDRVNDTVLQIVRNSTVSFPDYIYELLNVNGSLYDADYWEYQPGESFAFGTLDFEILCYIAELVTGITILDYIQNNILNPLSMTETKNSYSDYLPSRIATPYLWDPILNLTKQMIPIDFGTRLDYKTTVQDLSKFQLDLMNGFTYGNSSLLNSTTITELMFKHQGNGHGLGIWVDWNDEDWQYKGYFGNGPGYTSIMFFKNEIGVVCFANQGAFNEDFSIDIDLLGKIVNYKLYVMSKAQKLLIVPTETPTPTKTPFAYLSSFLTLSLVSSLFVLIRRRK